MPRLPAVVLVIGLLVNGGLTFAQESYDEWEESPTITLEGCGVYPGVRVVIEGRETEARGVISRGRTFLPARESLERLGATVRWNRADRAFYAELPDRDRTVRVAANSRTVIIYRRDSDRPYAAGEWLGSIRMDVAPFICGGRVYAPVRTAVEAAGGSISFDRRTRTVYVNPPASENTRRQGNQ